MIGNESRGAAFVKLSRYLREDDTRVDWAATRNLTADADDWIGVKAEMEDIAATRPRCKEPVYHLSLSWHPDDDPTRAQMEVAAERVLARLKLAGHQVYIVAHDDKDHAHLHVMANRVHPDPGRKVWGGWINGQPWTYRAVEAELRALERDMGWTVTPGHLADVNGRRRPARNGDTRKLRFGAEITVKAGSALANARTWQELATVLQDHGWCMEARERGMVITDGARYIGACRIHALKGGRPDLEDRYGQALADFLETGQSPPAVPATAWVWRVRMMGLYHARRYFRRSPELAALYRETVRSRDAQRAKQAVQRAELALQWAKRDLLRAERAAADVDHARRMLLYSLRRLLVPHPALDVVVILAGLTMSLARLGADKTLSLLRSEPSVLGLPGPVKGGLEAECGAYAAARAKATKAGSISDIRRRVLQAERALSTARRSQAALSQGSARDIQDRRRRLSLADRRALSAFESAHGHRERAVDVADVGR